MDKLEELLKSRAEIDLQLEKMRTPITILFSDIRGSTAFFEAEGDVQGLAMVEDHNRVLFPVIERNDGRVVKTIGDAIMARFDKAENALRAAIGMQQALAAHNQNRGPNQQIHIRIGVHSGLGLVKNGDVYGDVVNTASRVETHSEPDNIFVSSELLSAANFLGINATSAGFAELKGKAGTVELHRLDWRAYTETVAASRDPRPGKKNLSLLLAGALVLLIAAASAMWLRQPAGIQGRTPNSSSEIRGASLNSQSDDKDLTAAELTQIVAPLVARKPEAIQSRLNATLRDLRDGSPGKIVTRAEAALVLEDLLVAATGKNDLAKRYIGADSSPFSDVQTTHPAFNAIMTVTTRNLLPPRAGDRFAPGEAAATDEFISAFKRIGADSSH
jgi:class 3 adenylate cyclase